MISQFKASLAYSLLPLRSDAKQPFTKAALSHHYRKNI